MNSISYYFHFLQTEPDGIHNGSAEQVKLILNLKRVLVFI